MTYIHRLRILEFECRKVQLFVMQRLASVFTDLIEHGQEFIVAPRWSVDVEIFVSQHQKSHRKFQKMENQVRNELAIGTKNLGRCK